MKFKIEELIKKTNEMAARSWKHRSFNDLGALLPESKDPSVLFKNNWLAYGQSFAIVGSSGIGKSSITDQMAYFWASGEPFLAEPMKALKIAIIQAEDSDRDLKEQRDGMIRGLKEFHSWDDNMVAIADERIDIPTDFVGLQGDEFLHLLRDYQHDCRCDLLFVNPLQRYFGGDVSSQEDASHFCAECDKIMKDPDCPCAMGIDMHTPKFKSGQKDDRASVDDYGEYLMAGSHEWTDWCRAVLCFLKKDGSDNYFDFRATKRGKRLSWKDAEGNPTTKKVFKHSDGFIFWQEVTDPEELESIPKPEPKKAGRTPKERLDIERSAITVTTKYTDMIDGAPRPKIIMSLWENDHHEHTKSEWSLVVDHIFSDPEKYGFRKLSVKESNGKSYPRLFLASNKK